MCIRIQPHPKLYNHVYYIVCYNEGQRRFKCKLHDYISMVYKRICSHQFNSATITEDCMRLTEIVRTISSPLLGPHEHTHHCSKTQRHTAGQTVIYIHSKNEIVILVGYNNNTLYSCLSMSTWMVCVIIVSMFSSFLTNTDNKHTYTTTGILYSIQNNNFLQAKTIILFILCIETV